MKTSIALVAAVLCLAVGRPSPAASPCSISISPAGNFAVVDDEMIYGEIPQSLHGFLQTLSNQGERVECIALSGEDGWIVLYGDGQAGWMNLPADFVEAFNNIRACQQRIKSVAFTPSGGWVILFGKNLALWNNIPLTATIFLNAVCAVDETTTSISFADDEQWVIECSLGRYFFDFPGFLVELYENDPAAPNIVMAPGYDPAIQEQPAMSQYMAPAFLPPDMSSQMTNAATESYWHRKWDEGRWNESHFRETHYRNVFNNLYGR